ncbi:protein translocase subunit SECA2, chloroplastic isoform X4 [Prunus dulcis]|uniref:protein translocase subunit SECA2, chloroplastic isoform X4 n=1 Tax=Prunus dulcis TaxID=3755 RepID=UPI0014824F4C|nr:protein translocase subunit SECA2, chloroplastic isoform X4 [Prunus dulcis]
MESLDLPECPVCLQNYDGEYTIPRVLACGHSACEACLVRLPKRYPETIRCPACTQLVKYPPLGPTALPKNIDLLSFSLSLNPNPNSRSSQNPQKQSTDGVCKFLPRIWSDEFYDTWKEWVLPSDALSVETEVGDVTRDGLCTVLKGRTGSGSGFGLGSGRVWFREDQSVSFVQVGSLPNLGSSGFEFSYIARVMKCLSGMREGERNELGLLLRASVRQCRKVGKVYGLWGNSEDGFLYVVCERRNGSFSEKLNELRDGDGFGKDGLSAFAMIAMEVCEAVTGLHSEGFASGCFGVSCFGFDDFGHVFVDLSEVLVTGKKAWRSVVDSVSGTMEIDAEVLGVTFGKLLKDDVFVSPEVLFEALQKEGIAVECDSSRYLVGYGSDVCSLACVLVRLLLGKEFSEEIVKTSENLFRDHSTYASWIERVSALLEIKFGSEYASLKENLCNCLNFNPESRPLMIDVMKCIRELIIKPQCDITAGLDGAVKDESANCCLILGELCQIPKQISETQKENELQGSKVSGGADFDQVGDERTNNGVVDGLAEGKVKSKVMQGHRDSITGLAVGGELLFSSSFDKTIHLWSLQDFSHVHTFKGHEHAIKALIYVDEEQPLCISGDSGGGIFIWGACTPLGQEPLKILYEEKDWRFSGIHAMASRNGYVYTGSGDRTVKAWSVRDGTLSCTMSGHRSVVSTLAVCDGVLYSGSWDGTIRLWSLSDHSPLTVLEEDASGTVTSVLSLVVDRHLLIATHENGCVKVWRNDVFMKSIKMHNGAVFASGMEGKWLFTGGWDKTVNIQELSGDEIQIDYRPVGFIPCDSVITTLLSWQGKLFVGHANRNITENLGLLTKTWSDVTSLNSWVVRDYYRLVSSVNSLEPQIQRLTDDQLTAKTAEFRQRLWKGETLADIQAEAFAVVREAAKRKLGMRHFDVQIIGGAVLHDGSIAEMKTGEGKTLVSTLAAYLNALTGEGVHVVTVNDYLAQRDAEWMGRVHRLLGLTVGLVQRGMTAEERRSNYSCDITYTNNSELGFDYLRDNLAGSSGQLVMRWPKPFHFAIVDEVDSVLIDEGRNPLLISGEASKDAARYPVAAKVADLLVRDIHYKVELKDNSVELTEEGIALAEMALETNDLWDENDPWARFVMNALKAKEFYRQDVQYIVRNGKALIINELTGRVEEKRRWSEGIHQAVEAKEGLKIQADSVVVAQITYQSLFKLYPKLSGMTGTAKTEEKEFLKMFQVPVIEVPTNLPNIRNDLPIQAFATAQGKWEYVRQEVEYMFRQGRPVLVGSTSVENSEYLSDLLKEQNIPHNVLNARPKYAAREAEIVAQAGRKYAITISTNMAGRGTDIILGGNPKMLAKEIIEDSLISFLTREAPNVDVDGEAISQKVLSKIKVGPSSLAFLAKTALMAKYVSKNEGKSWTYKEAKSMISESVEMSQSRDLKELERLVDEQSEMYPLGPTIALAYLSVLKDCEVHCLKEGSEVKKLGGLHVIGTSLHESRRIDNQLRGRAGRQGDPGSTRFMVSLQDEMFQKFNFDTEWAVRLISKITNDEDMPIEGDAIVKQLLALQINAEKYFFGIRKSLVEFDGVLEVQRKHVYELRQSILTGDNESCSQHIFQYMQAVVDEIVFANVNALKHPRNWSLGKLLEEFMTISGKLLDDSFAGITEEALLKSLAHSHELNSIDLDDIHLPNLPRPPKAFRGIRKKSSSLKRWLAICSDDLTKNGRYHAATSLLRKYLGDFLIVSYLDVIEESGYDDAYVKEVERAVLVKTLDCFWRDHLVNMNRLSSAVNVRSFGHRNPLEEYKIDGCRFFISMLSATRRLTVESLLQYWSSPIESQEIFLS